MKQKLTLEIDNVRILRGFGPDELILSVKCPEDLNAITRDHMAEGASYVDLFGDSLNFEIKIASGAGEKLAAHLGLKVDEVIKV